MTVMGQPAAGLGVSDQVRKSQDLTTGKYVPASQMTSAQRQQMMAEMRRRKALGLSSQQFWRQKAQQDPVLRALRVNDAYIRSVDAASLGTVGRPQPGSAFRNGFMSRIPGFNPGRLMDGSHYSGAGGVVPGLRGGLRVMENPNVSSVLGPKDSRMVGVHESAHYATDSQARRGRTRSPYRLAQIKLDPMKIAREEARADATGRRVVPRSAPSGYEAGRGFDRAQKRAYRQVRSAAGQPAKPLWVIPAKVRARKFARLAGFRGQGGWEKAETAARWGPALFVGGAASYEAWRQRKDPNYRLFGRKKGLAEESGERWRARRDRVRKAAGVQVHERTVHPLEHRFERQRRLGRAAAEGGLSLSAGDYEYLPVALGTAGVRRKKPTLRRAYVSRSNPRWFDRVEYASTDDSRAQLQSRQRTGWDVAGRRALQAAQVGAAAGGAGLLLGSRRALKDPKVLWRAARAGRPQDLLPSKRGLKVAGGLAAAGATAGGLWRPSPVAVRYGRQSRA